ncbi:hypothetical protein FDA94_24000 [Herbidospora galbida]|uniref:Uncharacterized protein n=1 Tax=Herbidospora galbida TaxID=2575442 RepID=A0A4U3MC26_9ACTN|nr:hypothetical protein [Herbidospora galbida]TKK85962.1 hypothetical protein FDA94_24000 [Herbidospora galbida]
MITLRPGTRARFSTNFYHQTWHILSDPHGALLLSRLLWGLSFQRQPDTVVIIDRRFIDPNPFDAKQGDPIALVPADLTHLRARTARHLSRRSATPGTTSGTVRWHTWGLDAAVDEWRTQRAAGTWWRVWRPEEDVRAAEVTQLGGLLNVRASSSLLRRWAVHVATMRDHAYKGMSYTELDGSKWEPCRSDGEVQTFRDYRQRVSVATISRREVLAAENELGTPAELRPLVWSMNDTVRSRRR